MIGMVRDQPVFWDVRHQNYILPTFKAGHREYFSLLRPVVINGDNVLNVPDEEKQVLIDGGYDGKTVVLGIRPENISDDPDFLAKNQDHAVKTTIKVHEMLGAEVFLYFDVNGTQMTARVAPDSPLRAGSEATLAFDMDKIHLFDKETEKNLLHPEW